MNVKVWIDPRMSPKLALVLAVSHIDKTYLCNQQVLKTLVNVKAGGTEGGRER